MFNIKFTRTASVTGTYGATTSDQINFNNTDFTTHIATVRVHLIAYNTVTGAYAAFEGKFSCYRDASTRSINGGSSNADLTVIYDGIGLIPPRLEVANSQIRTRCNGILDEEILFKGTYNYDIISI
jgi:hypothetical protein